MKVEIWSDVVCPFCYIGLHRFKSALALYSDKENVTIRLRSFLLAPNYQPKQESVYSYMAHKNRLSIDEAHQRYQQITQVAKSAGLVFNFDKAIPCNTIMAHQLLHWAQQNEKEMELEEKFFAAYFTNGINLNLPEQLASLCEEVGLNKEQALAICNSDQYIQAINEDVKQASQLEIRGVPFFLFENEIAVKGAQSPEYLLDVMNQLKE